MLERLEGFRCPADPALYSEGKHSYTETNVATLKGGNVDLKADANVTVNCTLPKLQAAKTAAGSYDRKVEWSLAKSVSPASHSGNAGQSFNSTWTVTATKSAAEANHKVTGTITVTNPAAIAQTFTVTDRLDDGTEATVSCPTGTVAAGATVSCTYTAATAKAKENVATVSAAGNADVTAKADVSYTANVIGDESVTLGDARFTYSTQISADKTQTFPETFTCPTDAAKYDSTGKYSFTPTNLATLTGTNTNLEASAAVVVNCTIQQWADETATGAGKTYPGSNNWFMYTKYTTSKVDLIAGQHYDAGDIHMSRNETTTFIRIDLHDGYRWANVLENLKIQDFNKEPTSYVEPGAFKHKWTIDPSKRTVTVEIPGVKAGYYGIHGDVQRLLR